MYAAGRRPCSDQFGNAAVIGRAAEAGRSQCSDQIVKAAVSDAPLKLPARWGAQDIKFNVHAHPTLSEVLDELFKGAHVEHGKPAKAPAALDSAKQPVAA
jgi:hypothetical protein